MFIGVYGFLGIHGIQHNVHWTHLSQTAKAGDNQIVLDDPVDWEIGSEILITSTNYDPWESEVLRVTGKSTDCYTLTLNANLTYKHLGHKWIGKPLNDVKLLVKLCLTL